MVAVGHFRQAGAYTSAGHRGSLRERIIIRQIREIRTPLELVGCLVPNLNMQKGALTYRNFAGLRRVTSETVENIHEQPRSTLNSHAILKSNVMVNNNYYTFTVYLTIMSMNDSDTRHMSEKRYHRDNVSPQGSSSFHCFLMMMK